MPSPGRLSAVAVSAITLICGNLGVSATQQITSSGAVPAVAGAAVPAGGQVEVGSATVSLGQHTDPWQGRLVPEARAAQRGMYGPVMDWPAIPIHASVQPDGQLLTYGGKPGVAVQRGLDFDVWDPAAGASGASHTNTASMHGYNSFCNGITSLPDGRYLMVGGNSVTSSMIYDPATGAQEMGPQLSQQRWYASVLRRPDGRVLVLGGGDYYYGDGFKDPDNLAKVAEVPEIGDGRGAWRDLTGAASGEAFGAANNAYWYPRAYNAADGSVVGVSWDKIWRTTTEGEGSTVVPGTSPFPIGTSGASVMYRPGRILLAGGGQPAAARGPDRLRANRESVVVDVSDTSNPQVGPRTPMNEARHWLNMTALPDGDVLATGGTSEALKGPSAVYEAELWDPMANTWRKGDAAARIRTYHSVAALLPSGAVFTGGGGAPGPVHNLDAELYYPPSLFTRVPGRGVRWAKRPEVTSIAGDLRQGGQITLGTNGHAIASATLTSASNVTHSYNSDQRRIPLTRVGTGDDEVSFGLPADHDVLPSGSYLLSVLDRRGVPSPSQMITLRTDEAGLVTVHPEVPRAAEQQVRAPLRDASSVSSVSLQHRRRLTLSAAGRNVWRGADDYAAVSRPGSVGVGGSVTARVVSQTDTNPAAKAGVVLRNDIAGRGRSRGYAIMVATPRRGLALQWDGDGNGKVDREWRTGLRTRAPVWVRLSRPSRHRVVGAWSADGSTWRRLGSIWVGGGARVQDAGVLMTSRAPSRPGTAVFTGLRFKR